MRSLGCLIVMQADDSKVARLIQFNYDCEFAK
jgi:hypothetical protein